MTRHRLQYGKGAAAGGVRGWGQVAGEEGDEAAVTSPQERQPEPSRATSFSCMLPWALPSTGVAAASTARQQGRRGCAPQCCLVVLQFYAVRGLQPHGVDNPAGTAATKGQM